MAKTNVLLGYKSGTGEAVTVQDGSWLSGIADGEACFGLYIRKRNKPNCYSFDFTFKVSLRADDIKTLREIRRILGVTGSLCTVKRPAGSNGKPLSTFQVQKKSELALVIQVFDKFPLRSKKSRDYKIWKEAFEYYHAVIGADPIKSVAYGTLFRESKKNRRPMVGTVKSKLRRTPKQVVRKMELFEKRIRKIRIYHE